MSSSDDEPREPRTVWPMYMFAAAMIVLGIALSYMLLWPHLGQAGRYTYLVCMTPFAAAVAAIGAVREEVADQLRRRAEQRAHRRAHKEYIAPHPAEPLAHDVDGGPFRGAPKPPTIVAHAETRAPTAPIVPGDAAPPKLLT